jgi:hypothetical protein
LYDDSEFYGCELNNEEYLRAINNFERMCNIYYKNEEKRFEAKVESGKITLEDEVLN